jgi:hypothetical protein
LLFQGLIAVAAKLKSNQDIARRVRELADKREREAARASRGSRRQLNAIATNYRALAEALERTTPVAEKRRAKSPVDEV